MYNGKMKNLITIVALSFLSTASMASTVFLINGVGSPVSWINTGIYDNLSKNKDLKVNVFATPYHLSIQAQSQLLLREISKGSGPIFLIGHSAGGIVARHALLSMNQKGKDRVMGLITVATPHRGSSIARTNNFINNKIPFGDFFTKFISKKSSKSRYVSAQLMDSSPLLMHMNNLEHPGSTCYVSIVKRGGKLNNYFAKPYSQDMNNINNINAGTLYSKTGHDLHESDYLLIRRAMNNCNKYR